MARYVYDIAGRPVVVWGTVVVTAAVGALANVFAVVTALAAIAGGVAIVGAHPTIRARIDASLRVRQVRRARDERETRLEEANARRHGLEMMTDLVDAITRYEPAVAERMDLERVLDRYADLAITSARWRQAIERIDVARLLYVGSAVGPRRRAIVQRRIEHWQRCRDRLLEIEDELAAVHELFAALALRLAARAV